MERVRFSTEGRCQIENTRDEPKVLLCSLVEANEAGCLTKETLSSLTRALDRLLSPLLIIYSNRQENLQTYDFYFYKPVGDIQAPATLVYGHVFSNLSSIALDNPNAVLSATPNENPFALFYRESSAFLALRIVWILLFCLAGVLVGLAIRQFVLNSDTVVFNNKILLFAFCLITCALRILFWAIGGDLTSLFKRILQELGVITPYFCNALFLLLWLRVLKYSYNTNGQKTALIGYTAASIAILLALLGFVIRILAFTIGGLEELSAVLYPTFLVSSFVIIFVFIIAAVVRVLFLLKGPGSSQPKKDFLRKYTFVAGLLIALTLLTAILFGILTVFNKDSLPAFQARLWLAELSVFLIPLFYSSVLFSTTKPASQYSESKQGSKVESKLDSRIESKLSVYGTELMENPQ